MSKSRLQAYSFSALSALAMSFAWWQPGLPVAVLFGWIAAVFLILATQSGKGAYLPLYFGGLILQPLCFYWLFETIQDFGGFATTPTTAIFMLFVVLSALQYPIYILIYRCLSPELDRWSLRCSLAWVAAEFASIRIFPWYFGHTQLAFTPLAQTADIAGVLGISFLMLWLSESVLNLLRRKTTALPTLLSALIFTLALLYGYNRIEAVSKAEAKNLKVAVVQANISTVQKHARKMFLSNMQRYLTLSKQSAQDDLLILWPESVMMEWIYAGVGNSANDPRLPKWDSRTSILMGAMTYQDRETFHNSALAIYETGHVPTPYHKRILMPFGEYTPLSEWLPWLQNIHNTPDYTAGTAAKVFYFPLRDSDGNKIRVGVAPLICYEDLVPRLARESVRAGAELLVNLTNDAWFGHSHASRQHHLIAAFRAIENRRTLVRATNTGLTAIVNPLGQNIAELPTFSEGIINRELRALSMDSPYTTLIGEWPWWLLCLFCACAIVYRGAINKRSKESGGKDV